jgi:hypothetical protein
MKTKLLTTLFLLITVMSFAQDQKIEHLSFKGVPIDGTLIEYVAKMKQNGFNHLATKDGIAFLNGDFAGYKDCSVGVSTLKQKDLVHKIVVVFPSKETWSMLFGNYSDLKEMLSEKYGNPSEVSEKFDGFEPSDDKSKMYEVGSDRCKYHSIWQTDKGNIQLSISHKGHISSFVTLAYIDKTNGEVIRANAIDDL